MKNFLKTIALCLVLAMTFAMVPVLPVFAEDAEPEQPQTKEDNGDNIIEIGVGGEYLTLNAACGTNEAPYWGNLANGKTFKLVSNVTESTGAIEFRNFTQDAKIVLDGNGYTIALYNSIVVATSSGIVECEIKNLNITVIDSRVASNITAISARGNSKVTVTNCSTDIKVGSALGLNNAGNGELIVESGSFASSQKLFQVQTDCSKVNKLTINGGVFFSIAQNTLQGTQLTINGGTFIHYYNGRLFYNNLTSKTGVECKLTINGGDFYTPKEQTSLFNILGGLSNPAVYSIDNEKANFYNIIYNKLNAQNGNYAGNGTTQNIVEFDSHPTINNGKYMYVLANTSAAWAKRLRESLETYTVEDYTHDFVDGSTIVLASDIDDAYAEGFLNIDMTKSFVLDGYGHSITTEHYYYFAKTARGTAATQNGVRINVEFKNVKINYTSETAGDGGTNNAVFNVAGDTNLVLTNVDFNCTIPSGTKTQPMLAMRKGNNSLTINSGNYFITRGNDIIRLSDANAQIADITVNGGSFNASTFLNFNTQNTAKISVDISGGTFDCSSVVFNWSASNKAVQQLTITGGTFICNTRMFVMTAGSLSAPIDVVISGGNFTAKQAMFDKSASTTGVMHNITITGGDFNVTYQAGTTRAGVFNLNGNTKVDIDGGTFTQDVAFPFVFATAEGVNVDVDNATVNVPDMLYWGNGKKADVFDASGDYLTIGEMTNTTFNKHMGYSCNKDIQLVYNEEDGKDYLKARESVAFNDANLGVYGTNPDSWFTGYRGVQAAIGENGTYNLRVYYVVEDASIFNSAGFVFSANGEAVLDKNNLSDGVVEAGMKSYYTSIKVRDTKNTASDLAYGDTDYANGKIFAVIITGISAELMASDAVLYINFYAQTGETLVQSDVGAVALNTIPLPQAN